jgi:hypothetical protein
MLVDSGDEAGYHANIERTVPARGKQASHRAEVALHGMLLPASRFRGNDEFGEGQLRPRLRDGLNLRGFSRSASIPVIMDYQCWFCGNGIESANGGAENLWKWESGSRNEDDPYQAIFAHSACAKTRMIGATMRLKPDIFGDDD